MVFLLVKMRGRLALPQVAKARFGAKRASRKTDTRRAPRPRKTWHGVSIKAGAAFQFTNVRIAMAGI